MRLGNKIKHEDAKINGKGETGITGCLPKFDKNNYEFVKTCNTVTLSEVPA